MQSDIIEANEEDEEDDPMRRSAVQEPTLLFEQKDNSNLIESRQSQDQGHLADQSVGAVGHASQKPRQNTQQFAKSVPFTQIVDSNSSDFRRNTVLSSTISKACK